MPSGHLAKNAFLLVWSQNVYSHIFHMRKPIKILEEDNFQIRKPIKMLEKNFQIRKPIKIVGNKLAKTKTYQNRRKITFKYENLPKS